MTPTDLRTARLALGLTQVQLAGRLGVTPTTVARWERGEVRQGTGLPEWLRLAVERIGSGAEGETE